MNKLHDRIWIPLGVAVVVIGGGGVWASNLNFTTRDHETRLVRVENTMSEKVPDMQKDIAVILKSIQNIEENLKPKRKGN